MPRSSTRQVKGKSRKKPRWVRNLKILGLLFFILIVGLAAAGYWVWLGALNSAASKLGDLDTMRVRLETSPTTILSADNKVLFSFSNENREWVTIQQVPQLVKDATIAAEDKRFYEHSGIDTVAIVRQLFTNVRERRVAGGASTLTMQLAKRLYSGSEKTIERKLGDMALAVQMERRFTKDAILELYLNQVFYGSWAYGIRRAADVYFGKPLEKLTVGEAALISRCVRRPSSENPFVNLPKAVENRNVVLKIMLEEGMIDRATYEKSVHEKPKLRSRQQAEALGKKTAPYFVDYVLHVLREELPGIDLAGGGYRIETTLDSRMQRASERAVAEIVREYRRQKVRTAAFLLTDNEGRILAMVGGGDYERNQFNVISQGLRQPGSSFKPFVYAAALQTGDLDMRDRLSNDRYRWTDPATGKVWEPKNSSGKYGGDVSVRSALAWSMNMPAIRVMERIGGSTFVPMAKSVFGFESPLDPVLSLALGSSAVSPMEMAQGYSVFMNGGNRFRPFAVRRVISPDGEVVRSINPQIAQGVLSPEVAADMDDLLRAVVTEGTARRAQPVVNARGKTGTTSDNRDAWFIGYTDRLLGVGWVANEVPGPRGGAKWVYEPMSAAVFGGTVTIKVWTEVMKSAQELIGEKPVKREPSPRNDRAIEPPPDGTDVAGVEDRPVDADPGNGTSEPPRGEPPADENASGNPADTGVPAEQPKATEPQTEEPAPKAEPPVRGPTITVPICADTNMVARPSCPEAVSRTFAYGKQPRRLCTMHRL